MSVGDYIAVTAIVVAIVLPLIGGLWKVATLLATVSSHLDSITHTQLLHERRIARLESQVIRHQETRGYREC